MHTSVLTELPHPTDGLRSRIASLLMAVLCGSLALYPLLEQFIAPVVAASFGLAILVVGAGLLHRRLHVPDTFVIKVWVAMLVVYVVWTGVAIARGNVSGYITQDSAGFLLYIGAMPVIYLLIEQHRLQRAFFRFVERLSLLIALASVALAIGFHVVLGEISTESLLLVNAFLAGLGLSWKIDHNSGVLGLYTNTAHLVMLGSALALYRFSLQRRGRDLLLVGLYLVAMLLDGRRALAISAFLQLLIVAPVLLRMLSPAQRLRVTIGVTLVMVAGIAANLDWIQQRFEFSQADESSATRYDQIPALLDKIAEHPVVGGGFGTVAAYIRSVERPFSYEVDFLATLMKLGLVGSALYFGAYLLGVAQATRIRDPLGRYLISAGLPFFFYMGTNGNQAMSTDSSMFHILLFLMIVFTLPPRTAAVRPTDPAPVAVPGAPAA